MDTISPTRLRANLFKILDQVIETGIPVKISRKGELLEIVPKTRKSKLGNLVDRSGILTGDPEDIVDISWDKEVHLDLP